MIRCMRTFWRSACGFSMLWSADWNRAGSGSNGSVVVAGQPPETGLEGDVARCCRRGKMCQANYTWAPKCGSLPRTRLSIYGRMIGRSRAFRRTARTVSNAHPNRNLTLSFASTDRPANLSYRAESVRRTTPEGHTFHSKAQCREQIVAVVRNNEGASSGGVVDVTTR